MSEYLAVIDIGTNACKLKVTDIKGIPVEKRFYNLPCNSNEKLNMLNKYQMNKNFEIYKKLLSQFDINLDSDRLKVIATEGFRKASNSDEVREYILETFGANIEIVDTRREAELSIKGAVSSFDNIPNKNILSIDIGGGSTEIILANNDEKTTIKNYVSIPIGSRNLASDLRNTPKNFKDVTKKLALKEINSKMEEFKDSEYITSKDDIFLIMINSSALFSIINKEKGVKLENREMTSMSLKDVKKHFKDIQNMTNKEIIDEGYLGLNFKDRLEQGMEKEDRVYQFKEGVFILDSILEKLELPETTMVNASKAGVKEGVILEMVDEFKPKPKNKFISAIKANTYKKL